MGEASQADIDALSGIGKVKATSSDASAGFLQSKLSSTDASVGITKNNPSGNETLTLTRQSKDEKVKVLAGDSSNGYLGQKLTSGSLIASAVSADNTKVHLSTTIDTPRRLSPDNNASVLAWMMDGCHIPTSVPAGGALLYNAITGNFDMFAPTNWLVVDAAGLVGPCVRAPSGNGNTTYMYTPNATVDNASKRLADTGQWTVSAWMFLDYNPGDTISDTVWLWDIDYNYPVLRLLYTSGYTAYAYWYSDGVGGTQRTMSYDARFIPFREWFHIAFYRWRWSNIDNLVILINGRQIANITVNVTEYTRWSGGVSRWCVGNTTLTQTAMRIQDLRIQRGPGEGAAPPTAYWYAMGGSRRLITTDDVL